MKKPQKERGVETTGKKPVYSRIVVKLSGESLSGPDAFGIHAETIAEAKSAGANLFVVGSYLQEPPTIGEAFARLASACA